VCLIGLKVFGKTESNGCFFSARNSGFGRTFAQRIKNLPNGDGIVAFRLNCPQSSGAVKWHIPALIVPKSRRFLTKTCILKNKKLV
jgi:hypothetical protein